MKISISICPTTLEFNNGDRYGEDALLDAIRGFIARKHPDATISCLQVGHRQGDEWATVDGDADAGGELIAEFFDVHGTEAGLFLKNLAARLESRADEGTGWYVYVNDEDAGGPFETEAEALSHWSSTDRE